MWIVENAAYLYQKDMLVERAIADATNVHFNVSAFQDGSVEKVNLGLASGDLPDIYFNALHANASEWGVQGALVDFTKHIGDMPNFSKWLTEMKATKGDYVDYFYSAGGELFIMPCYGFGVANNNTYWMYRKDIFDKHNLKTPNNEDEFYQVCMDLKELYPDSYPFVQDGFAPNPQVMDRIAYQFGSAYPSYYNNDQAQWVYGPVEPGFKKAVEWLARMYADELLPSNILSMDNATWREYVTTNRGFILTHYQANQSGFNSQMKESIPDVEWHYMPPWEGGGSGVKTINPQTQLIISGYTAFTTSKKIPELIKFYDWLYTEEAKIITSWGVEDESYIVNPDGSWNHIDISPGDDGLKITHLYGLFQRGFYCVTDPAGQLSYADEGIKYSWQKVQEDSGPYRIPSIAFTLERQDRRNPLITPIQNHMIENVGKFITSQRPIDEYDKFVEELYAMGLTELMEIANEQQAEINANRK